MIAHLTVEIRHCKVVVGQVIEQGCLGDQGPGIPTESVKTGFEVAQVGLSCGEYLTRLALSETPTLRQIDRPPAQLRTLRIASDARKTERRLGHCHCHAIRP